MPKGNPGVKKSPEHNAKVSAALRGKLKSDAHRVALSGPKSEAHKRSLSLAQTPEVQAQRQATMLALHGVAFSKQDPRRNCGRIEYWIEKGMSKDEATAHLSRRQKEYTAQRVNHVSTWQASYWERQGLSPDEARIKVSELQTRNAEKSIFTISREGTAFLNKIQVAAKVRIVREEVVCGRFKVDGCIPDQKIVIEYLGSFWHMHPDLFAPNDKNRVTGWIASSKWAEDQGRVNYLTAAGWKVFAVWDCDVTPELINSIAKEINHAC